MPQAMYTSDAEWLDTVGARLDSASVRRVALDHAALADERGVLQADARALASRFGLGLTAVRLARAALIDAGLLVYLERSSAQPGSLQLQLPRR